MRINFNHVRKKAIDSFNNLIRELNAGICEDVDRARVVVPVRDIERDIDILRDALVSIGCAYVENDPDCVCIIEEDDKILEFNPEELE
jgi:predicted DNA-binding transcriptional regulator YafY